MIGAGINDGDYLVVHPQQEVAPREIAVVRIGGEEATTKHFFREGQHGAPRARERELRDHHRQRRRVELVGKVVGVLRQL